MFHLSEISFFRVTNKKILNYHFLIFTILIKIRTQFSTKFSSDSSASELLNNPTPMKSSTPGKSRIIKFLKSLFLKIEIATFC